jgi:predicted DNA-binding protein
MEEKTNITMKMKTVRLPPEIIELLKITSLQQKRDESVIIREALSVYLNQDIDSGILVNASLQGIQNDISFAKYKVEILHRLFIFWLPYFFVTSPELPQTEERKAMIEKAKTRTASMMDQFKKEVRNAPSFLESLLADFIEIQEIEENQ